MSKICTKCRIEKPITEFHKRKRNKDGLDTWCKECKQKYAKEYRQINSIKLKESKREYNFKNREELNRKKKIYYKYHKEEAKIYCKKYAQDHKDSIRKYHREWEKENPEKIKIHLKKSRMKQSVMPEWKLNHSISVAIQISLKGNKNGRSWEKIVGYTLDDLKKHLEKQFTIGMVWANYGKNGWEVDHKIPLSLFNINGINSKGFKKCWSLENLQPLWAEENRMKSNKLFVA